MKRLSKANYIEKDYLCFHLCCIFYSYIKTAAQFTEQLTF